MPTLYRRVWPLLMALSLFSPVGAEESLLCAGLQPRADTAIIEHTEAIHARTAPDARAKPLAALVPSAGRIRALVLFGRFADEAVEETQAPAYIANLFRADLPGSFAHYYRTMSFGQLTVDGEAVPHLYASTSPADAYPRLPGSQERHGDFGRFNAEILRAADADIDFGRFDDDGPDGIPNSGDDDGFVDYLFVALRSAPTDFLVGSATGIASLGLSQPFVSDDPAANGGRIRISYGATLKAGDFAHCVGSMAHEFGHALGLPDLYDRSFLEQDGEAYADNSAGIGRWGLMGHGTLGWRGDDGPAAMCAWSREQLGWLGPDNAHLLEVEEDLEGALLADVETGGRVYKMPIGEKEYFLLENRQPTGGYYDRNIPAGGLLIWHISQGSNDDETHKLVDLECADGLRDGGDDLDFWSRDATYLRLHGGNLGDATDPFDGVLRTEFSLATLPGSADHLGHYRNGGGGIAVEQIRREGSRIRADLRVRRWAGVIREPIAWSGTVRVTGDLTVESGAALDIRPGSRILFERGDRLASGIDPGRVELRVRGNLVAKGTKMQPIRFSSAESLPGDSDWYGILMDASAQWLRLDQVDIENAAVGLAAPEAPSGVRLWGWNSLDETTFPPALPRLGSSAGGPAPPFPLTIGDGDGDPGAGELFALRLSFKNLTFAPRKPQRLTARLAEGPITFSDGSKEISLSLSTRNLPPWDTAFIAEPELRLSIPAGDSPPDRLELDLEIDDGEETWKDHLSQPLAVEDRTPPFVRAARIVRGSQPGSLLLNADLLEIGPARKVVARLYTDDGSLYETVEMHPEPRGNRLLQTFSARWTPTEPIDGYLCIEAIDYSGNTTITGALAGLSTRRFLPRAPLLIVEEHPPDAPDPIGAYLEERNEPFDDWNVYYRGPLDGPALDAYGRGDRLVWTAPLDARQTLLLQEFLDRGGHLLLAREGLLYGLDGPPAVSESFARDYLHARLTGFTAAPLLSKVESAAPEGMEPFSEAAVDLLLAAGFLPCSCQGHNEGQAAVYPRAVFRGRISPRLPLLDEVRCSCGCGGLLTAATAPLQSDLLEPLSPATPLLTDAHGQPTGLRVGTDRFRLVYLGFRPQAIRDARQRESLLETALEFLQPTAPAETTQPTHLALLPNAPNPFNAGTLIRFGLDREGPATLVIYNPHGQLVRTLFDGPRQAGMQSLLWDGKDADGHRLASGVYFCKLRAGEYTQTRKLLLLR